MGVGPGGTPDHQMSAPATPVTPAVAVADHAEDADLFAKLHGQDHGEPACAQEGARLDPAKHRGRAGAGGTVLPSQMGYGCLRGDGFCDRGTQWGVLGSWWYLFFPVSFWKTSSQYAIFSSVRV